MYHKYERGYDSPEMPAPKITVSVSVEGEPWGTCNFRSWAEAIEHFKLYAKKEDEEKIKDVMNEHDRKALQLLKLFSRGVDKMIKNIKNGDAYTPSAIGGEIATDILSRIRDELVKARMADENKEIEELERE